MFNYKHLLWIIPLAIISIISLYLIKNYSRNSIIIKTIDTSKVLAPLITDTTITEDPKEKILYIDTLVKYSYTGVPDLDTALYYLNMGVKEKTGNNDGTLIEKWQKRAHGKKGDEWCAAFVSYCNNVIEGVLLTINTMSSQGFITKNSLKAKDVLYGRYEIPPGTVIIFRKGELWKGHVGKAYIWDTYHGQLVEGNSGNKVSFMERSIEPRNYFRIIYFTLMIYDDETQLKVNKYVPKWYSKTDNSTTDENSTR